MRRTLSLMAVVLIGVAGVSLSRTWYIVGDGSGDAPTIQAGIDSASAGQDTVLVGPGTYYESLAFADGVTLISEGGREVTRLHPRSGADSSVISCVRVTGLIEGFLFEGGPPEEYRGIYCSNSSVRIANNEFSNLRWDVGAGISCTNSAVEVCGNAFLGLSADFGAGIACLGLDNYIDASHIHDNLFEDNHADSAGGALYCSGAYTTVRGNSFVACTAERGGAISCRRGWHPCIHLNTIVGNSASYGGGIYSYGAETRTWIVGNTLRENEATMSGGAVYVDGSPAEIRENLIEANRSLGRGGLVAEAGADVYCEQNTFFGNTNGAILSTGGSDIDLLRCIIANTTGISAVWCELGGTADLHCNDLWLNSSDYLGCAPGSTDFYVDPLFCDTESGNFSLEDCSACLNRPGCGGPVGAFGSGCACGSVSRERSTWGAVKALYQ